MKTSPSSRNETSVSIFFKEFSIRKLVSHLRLYFIIVSKVKVNFMCDIITLQRWIQVAVGLKFVLHPNSIKYIYVMSQITNSVEQGSS
jgi:hypothetical protein